MIAITRTYNRNGAYLEDSDSLNFGKISAASYREPQIISLKVDDVDSASNVKLKIVFSQNTDISEGFVEYYTSKDIIQDVSKITRKKLALNQEISVDNLTVNASEYVYLWINPQKITYRGNLTIRFKWEFDYVDASSSSSSSSSCQYGEFSTISPFETLSLNVSDCENVYFKFALGFNDYSTLFIDGDIFVVENNGGCLIVNDTVLCSDGVCEDFEISGRTYTVCLFDLSGFFVGIYRAGDCTNLPHLLLTTRYDFLLKTGFRLLLLEGDTSPRDQLLMTDGETFWYVDHTGFYLLGESSSSSSSSSS